MITRCSLDYPRADDYGNRGITVCDEWRGRGGFERFMAHAGHRPTPKHSLDRIDNEGGYEPGNVRWATRKQQQRNMRNNLLLTVDGETKCLSEWAEESPVGENTIYYRRKRGWSDRDAVFLERQQGRKGPRAN